MADDFLARCRSSLENFNCPWVFQMPDSELEIWLLKPGPKHNKALIWALTKIDPKLRKHTCLINSDILEEELVRLFACSGLAKPSESDKVLGHAPRKIQESFWESILSEIGNLEEFEAHKDQENLPSNSTLPLLLSLVSNSNFLDLLEQKPNLLPPDIMLPPLTVTLGDLQNQLAEAEGALFNSIDVSDHSSELLSSSCLHDHVTQKEGRIRKDILEFLKPQINKVNDCYKRFQLAVTGIKRNPPNPAAEQLGQIVANLHGIINEISQFLKNVDKTKSIAASFSNRTLPENDYCLKNRLDDFIATVEQQISAIMALISSSKDLWEL